MTAAASFSIIDVPQIEAHPKNPRHKAAADDELVASVKEHGLVQPLIVAPIGPDGGTASAAGGVHMQRYILVAGHRRLHALKKARIKVAPAVVRHDLDTEAKQLEAMLLENSSRVDLTPIEEAEGYHQLTLLGYKQGQIAKLTGRSPKTVSTRLRLLKLAASTQKKVHTGQLTIEDAEAFVEFADDPEVTKTLEKAAAGTGLKYAIENARRIRKNNTETATREAELTARGIPVLAIPDGKTVRDLDDIRTIWNATEADLAEHEGCVAWLVEDSSWSGRCIRYYCTDPDKHAAEADEARDAAWKARQEQQQAEQAARAELMAKQDVAEELRLDTLQALVKGIKVDENLAAVLSACLPGLIRQVVQHEGNEPYQRLARIPESVRWGGRLWDDTSADYRKLVDHLEDIKEYDNPALVRTLVVALFMFAEAGFTSGERAVGQPYADLLGAAEHDWCDIDLEYRDALDTPADEDAEATA